MAERVVPDDGLMDPDGHAAQPLDEAREIVHPGNVDPRVVAVEGLEGEDELLEAPRPARRAAAPATIVALSPALATSLTPRASSLETTGIPASMIGTPISSMRVAISSFSSGVKATPGVCSPSRIVSSQIWIPAGRRPEVPPP